MSIEQSGKAIIEDGALVIRVAISALPTVLEGSWASGALDTRFKITDQETFAKELVHSLNEEAEDGTTRIHQMFDLAILHAIEYGAEGVEEHEKQEV